MKKLKHKEAGHFASAIHPASGCTKIRSLCPQSRLPWILCQMALLTFTFWDIHIWFQDVSWGHASTRRRQTSEWLPRSATVEFDSCQIPSHISFSIGMPPLLSALCFLQTSPIPVCLWFNTLQVFFRRFLSNHEIMEILLNRKVVP